MDAKQVKALLDETKSCFKEFIEMLMSKHSREINEIRNERSFEFSQNQLSDLINQVARQDNDIKHIKANSEGSDTFSERVRVLDDKSKTCNLRIDGMVDSISENSEQTQQKVEDLIKNKLKLNITLDSCNRLGKFSPNKQRVTLARFRSVTERNLCLRSSGKLKGTNIFLNEDLCKETVLIRKNKIPELNELRNRGYIAYFRGTEIIKRERTTNRSENTSEPLNLVPRFASVVMSSATTPGTVSDAQPSGSNGRYHPKKLEKCH